jgi:hypothetical protein
LDPGKSKGILFELDRLQVHTRSMKNRPVVVAKRLNTKSDEENTHFLLLVVCLLRMHLHHRATKDIMQKVTEYEMPWSGYERNFYLKDDNKTASYIRRFLHI